MLGQNATQASRRRSSGGVVVVCAVLIICAFQSNCSPAQVKNGDQAGQQTDLDRALNESVSDQLNSGNAWKLHDELMKSQVRFAVPDSYSHQFETDKFNFPGNHWRYVGYIAPHSSYTSVMIWSSLGREKIAPVKSRYSISVTGRQIFDFAKANGLGVILNPYSQPTIQWSPSMVGDYLAQGH